MTAGHIWAMVGISAAVTWALRALPFAVLAPMRRSTVVRYLSVHMPLGVMVILTLYTLRGVTDSAATANAAVAIALAVTLGLHWWRRNALLSIVVGTAVHVVLMSLVW